jgi:serine/threonine protein kinase
MEDENEFLANMKCSFQDRENCYFLMEYLDGGDLRYYINRNYAFNEEQISTYNPIQNFWSDVLLRDSTTSIRGT